jgi:flagellar biosynthetic protein FlhB
LALLAAVWGLRQGGAVAIDAMQASVRTALLQIPHHDALPAWHEVYLGVILPLAMSALAPVAVPALAVGLVVGLAQSGRAVSLRVLSPDISRLNPLNNLRRIVSGEGLVELGRAFLKLVIVVAAVQGPVRASFESLPVALGSGLLPSIRSLAASILDVAFAGTQALVALAAADFLYRRWQFARQARMTRQEVREELRQTEGDPLVRSRIRSLQRQLARRRMLHRVRDAQVVVTNPTHFAVALAYTPGKHTAPEVVAKGADRMAERIKEIAAEHRVPIVPNPPLAQALYKSVDVGQQIPLSLYQAVAEVLAYVYSLKRRS